MSTMSILRPPAASRNVAMSRKSGHGTLFEHAPPVGVQRRLGLVDPDNLHTRSRAALVVLVGWVPLVLLTLVQGAVFGTEQIAALLKETGVHARYLIAAPLLIAAEARCAPRLKAIMRHFVETGLVRDGARGRFDAALASTRRLVESPVSEVVVWGLAYTIAATSALSQLDQIPAWHRSGGAVPIFSLAGWWHVLVSLPLLLVLILGWIWRLVLWARLLWLVSRLDLRVIASHPDHAAGLSFVGHSVRAFAIVGLALATIAAGRSAHLVLVGGTVPTVHLAFNVGLLVFVAALFVAPLLAFTPILMQTWRRGEFEYGALAHRVGDAFEQKWLGGNRKVDHDALEQPDFSATTDLFQVVSNVHALRFVPIDLKDIITLAVAMLVPFVPVVLLAIPVEAIWTGIKSLLF
jgi:hypothetical protein